jgi:hypothetical protein
MCKTPCKPLVEKAPCHTFGMFVSYRIMRQKLSGRFDADQRLDIYAGASDKHMKL